MKKIAALAPVGALALLVGVWCYFGRHDDPFTAKYRLIQEGTTHEEAERFLGPSFDEYHVGDDIYVWISEDGTHIMVVTWNAVGQLSEKRLVSMDGTVELLHRPTDCWWQPLLARVGVR